MDKESGIVDSLSKGIRSIPKTYQDTIGKRPWLESLALGAGGAATGSIRWGSDRAAVESMLCAGQALRRARTPIASRPKPMRRAVEGSGMNVS